MTTPVSNCDRCNDPVYVYRITPSPGNARLCDICWGNDYGHATCARCQMNCYAEEDWDVQAEAHLCGRCQLREQWRTA